MATNWKWEDLDETYNGTSVIWSRSYIAIAGLLPFCVTWDTLRETWDGTDRYWADVSWASLTKKTIRPLAGALASSGAVVKKALKPLIGGLTSTGAIAKKGLKPLAGALTSAGAAAKKTGKTLAGLLPFCVTWDMLRETWDGTTRYWVDVSWASLTKKTLKPLAGALASSGAVVKKGLKPLAGALTSAGVITKQAEKALAGTLWFEVIIPIWEDVDEAWDATVKIWSRQTITTGELTKKTARALAGIMTSSGAITKKTLKPLAGILTSAGGIVRSVKKVIAGLLEFVGVSTPRYISPRKLTLPSRSLALTLRAE